MIQISEELGKSIIAIVSEFSTALEGSMENYKESVEQKKKEIFEKIDHDARESDMPDFIQEAYKRAASEAAQANLDETLERHNKMIDAIKRVKADITVALGTDNNSPESELSLNPVLEAFTDGFKSVSPDATLNDVLESWYSIDRDVTEQVAFVNGCKSAARRLK